MMGRASSYRFSIFLSFLVCFLLLVYVAVFLLLFCFRCYLSYQEDDYDSLNNPISPLHDLVTWYGVNYAGRQVTQWDFQSKRNLRPSIVSIINSVPCDRIVQRAYWSVSL